MIKNHNGRRNQDGTLHGQNVITAQDPDYTDDELEFMRAIDTYKARTGRKFLTLRETLVILKSLGYHK